MATQGTTTIDFGAFPGASDASVALTNQSTITNASLVEAWIYPTATADHTADEHLVETVRVAAGTVVAGTGFTIYGFNSNQVNEQLEIPGIARFWTSTSGERGSTLPSYGGKGTRIYGAWTVAWVWN